MPHCNTILSQILKFVPRHEFEVLANEHHSGRSFRKASRWSQFVTLSLAQLTGRNSLRDIVENMSAQSHRIYHMGCAKLSRSNLSRMNENKPYALYEALFGRLLARCQSKAPNHDFRFKMTRRRHVDHHQIYVPVIVQITRSRTHRRPRDLRQKAIQRLSKTRHAIRTRSNIFPQPIRHEKIIGDEDIQPAVVIDIDQRG